MSSPYKNFRHSSSVQTGKGMLQLLRTQLYAQNLGSGELAMSLVEKRNKSGNAYNERLLVLQSPGCLGYCRDFDAGNRLPLSNQSELPRIKAKIQLETMIEHWTEDDLLHIKFRQEGNKQPVTWVLRMTSPSLAYQWDNLIMDARTKSLEIHNRPEPQPPNSKRPSTLSLAGTIINQQITPTKSVDLEAMLERSGGSHQPFQIAPQISQVNPIPMTQSVAMQSSGVNFSSPVQTKNEHDDEIWVFPEFKERKSKTPKLKSVRSVEQIPAQQKSNSKDNSIADEAAEIRKETEAELELARQLKIDWSYEFMQADEIELLPLFGQFAKRLVTRLVDEFMLPIGLQQHKPRIKENDYSEYRFEFIKVGVAFSTVGPNGVYNERAKNRLINQFNNLNYLLRHAGNEGILRVSLACLVQYKGCCSLVTALVRTLKSSVNFSSLRSQLSELSTRTKINAEVFYDSDSLLLSAVDVDYYNRLARERNDPLLKSPLYSITDVQSFLPQDVFFGTESEHQMRPEFVQSLKLHTDGRSLKKSSLSVQQVQLAELEEASMKIIEIVDKLAEELRQYPSPIILPSDLQRLLHQKGVPLRYLGMLYETLESPELRKLVMSEIIARSLSSVVQGRLCSESFVQISPTSKQHRPTKFMENRNADLAAKLIELLKRMMNEHTADVEELWEEVDRTATANFHKAIDRDEISPQYFYISLIEESCLKVRWELFQKNFRLDTAGRSGIFEGLSSQAKLYDFGFLTKTKDVRRALDRPDCLNDLRKILGVSAQNKLPRWLKSAGLHQPVVRYFMQNGTFEDTLLGLEKGQLWGFFELSFLLEKVQHLLQERDVKTADLTADKLRRQAERSYSESHPLVALMLESYSDYHEKAGNLDEALMVAKNVLLTRIKFAGSKIQLHIGIYLRIAVLLTKLKRYSEAADYYQSIRQCIQKQNFVWVDTIIKEAKLYRAMNKLQIAEGDLRECFDWLCQTQPLNEKRIAQVVQLLSESIRVQSQSTKIGAFILQLQQICASIEEPEYLQAIFRHIIRYHYSRIARNSTEPFLALIKELTERELGHHNYGYAVSILRKRLAANKFWNNLKEYLGSLDKLLPYINQSRVLQSWSGFKLAPVDVFEDFLVVVSVILYFLGAEFVEEILNPRKQ